MTDREKAIVEAYTGVCMLVDEKRNIFYEYVNEVMGRPIYTHEFADEEIQKEIKEKSYNDFIELCSEETDGNQPEKSKSSNITLGEFAGAVRHDVCVKIELRNAKNKEICTCDDNSPVIGIYADCEVLDWWSVLNDGRVIVHIDYSEVMKCTVGNAVEKQ